MIVRFNMLFMFFGFWLIPAKSQSLAQQLGYPEDSRMLIIHADDLGVAHSVNRASIYAYQQGFINSGSIMVPCPWFDEIAKFFLEHPQFDYGLHLTLTNEWKYFNWDGVAPKSEIPSLLNAKGYLYHTVEDVLKYASIEEVEIELRAQIERALEYGLNPSHLDSHMGVLYQSPELIQLLLKLSGEYGIPAMYITDRLPATIKAPEIDYGLTSIFGISEDVPAEKWAETYHQHIRNLGPGLHEIIIHLSYDDAEMQAMTVEFEGWHAAWRQRDLNYVASPDFKKLLQDEGIIMVNWSEVQKLLK